MLWEAYFYYKQILFWLSQCEKQHASIHGNQEDFILPVDTFNLPQASRQALSYNTAV